MTNRVTEKVSVSILNRPFEVACLPEEKQALKKAANLLDKRMRELRNQGAGNSSFDKLIVVVALNLCHEIMAAIPAVAPPTSTAMAPEEITLYKEGLSADTLSRLIEKIDATLADSLN